MNTDLEVLKPLWSCGYVFPTSLVDLLDADDWEADDQVDHEKQIMSLTVLMKVMSDK